MTATLEGTRALNIVDRYIQETFADIFADTISIEDAPFLPLGRLVTLAEGRLLIHYDTQKGAVVVRLEDGSLALCTVPHSQGWSVL